MGVALTLAACSSGGDGAAPSATPPPLPTRGSPPTPPPGGVLVRFDDVIVAAEVADDDEERRVGLMNRESLAPDGGMIFLFPVATTAGFWMKDTLIPLSIGFLRATGPGRFRLAEIRNMEPCPPKGDCPLYEPDEPFDAALEVNKGWFADRGVRVGDEAVVEDSDAG